MNEDPYLIYSDARAWAGRVFFCNEALIQSYHCIVARKIHSAAQLTLATLAYSITWLQHDNAPKETKDMPPICLLAWPLSSLRLNNWYRSHRSPKFHHLL